MWFCKCVVSYIIFFGFFFRFFLFVNSHYLHNEDVHSTHFNGRCLFPELNCWCNICDLSGGELESFVKQYHWEGELHDGDPFISAQGCDLEDGGKDFDVQDDEVETEGKSHGADQPEVGPWGHSNQRLIFRQAVHGVQHFNGDKYRQSHGHWVRVVEDGAINVLEVLIVADALHVMGELVVSQLWAFRRVQEPPGGSTNGSGADVHTDSHVPEEQPSGDETFISLTWGLLHDVKIWGIEAESGSGKTVSDQVDPQELDWNKGFRKTKSGGQEDGDDFTNVGRDEVTDELLHVVVDGTAFLNGSDDGREVVVSQHHLRGGLGDSGTGAHGNTNFGLLQSGSVIDTITSHGGDFVHALQELNNLGLVSGLYAREETSATDSGLLFGKWQIVEFATRVGLASGIFIFGENANTPADSFSGGLVITSDDNDTDSSGAATDDRVEDFLTWGIQHTNDTDEGEVDFVGVEFGGVTKVHVVGLHWAVSGGKSQATESVTAGTVLAGEIQDAVLENVGEWHLLATDASVCTYPKHLLARP